MRVGGPHVSTGALLRRLLTSGEESPLVLEAREILAGKFVSDEFANRLAQGAIAGLQSFVLDGYPRTVAQAQALDVFLATQKKPLDAAILLEIGAEALATRLALRRICPLCSAAYHLDAFPPRCPNTCDVCRTVLVLRPEDDQPEKVALRLALYQEKTAPLADYYAAQGKLHGVNAEPEASTVFETICAVVKSLV